MPSRRSDRRPACRRSLWTIPPRGAARAHSCEDLRHEAPTDIRFPSLLAAVLTARANAVESTTVGDLIVTATRLETRIDDAPDARVITADDIAASQATFAGDILETVPGLSLSRNGDFGGVTLTCACAGASADKTLVLVDGVVQNDPSSPNGGYDFSSLDLADVQRIEVLSALRPALGLRRDRRRNRLHHPGARRLARLGRERVVGHGARHRRPRASPTAGARWGSPRRPIPARRRVKGGGRNGAIRLHQLDRRRQWPADPVRHGQARRPPALQRGRGGHRRLRRLLRLRGHCRPQQEPQLGHWASAGITRTICSAWARCSASASTT